MELGRGGESKFFLFYMRHIFWEGMGFKIEDERKADKEVGVLVFPYVTDLQCRWKCSCFGLNIQFLN